MPLAVDSVLHDPARLAALHASGLLDRRPDPALDRLVALARRLVGAPTAIVTLVDAERQVVAAGRGVPAALAGRRELPWSGGPCVEVVETGAPVVVDDAGAYAGVADGGTLAEWGVGAYLAVPLATGDGHVLGTLAVLDPAPRAWGDDEVDALASLADLGGVAVDAGRDVAGADDAERGRRASEARFHGFVESAHEGVWAIDADGRTTYANRRMAAMLGVAPEAMLGRDVYAFVDAASIDEARACIARQRHGLVESYELTLRRGDGAPLRALLSATGLRDARGGFGGVVALVSDVSERDRTEAALRESEARYADIAANIPGMVYQFAYRADGTAGYNFVSEGARAMFGVEPDDVLRDPQALLGLIHPDDYPAFRAGAREVATTLAPFRWEGRVTLASGEERIIQVAARARPVPEGGVVSDGVVLDVTETRLAARRLAEREAHLRLALDAADIVVWERDLRTDRVVFGVPLGSGPGAGRPIVERDYADFIAAVHPDDRDKVVAANAAAAETGGEFTVAYRIADGDGRMKSRETRGRVLAGVAGAPPRMIGVTLDVTGRAQLEAQLRQAQKMEAIGLLAGGVAHDFNNLLTVITASARFAREALRTDLHVLEDLAAIDGAAGRAAQLTRQLLAFSRKQLLRPQRLDVDDVVRRVAPLLRRLIGEDIEVLAIPTPALPPVLADAGQLEQVLINLAINARDAMPQGGRLVLGTRCVTVTPEEAAHRGVAIAPGPYVRLTVRDTGSGMDERTLGRVFEPFFTTKEPGKGTGLGLSTVYGIVKQSGGFVWVTSVPGAGTTFEIDLPVAPPAPEAVGATDTPARAAAALASGTVLLVEDDAAVRAVTRRILARQGYTVLEAPHGAAALDVIEAHEGRIDLVLTDVVMPEMSGRVFADEVARRSPGLRVLFMSGYPDYEIFRSGLLTPGRAFLEKPFTTECLLRTVRDALDDA